MKEKMKEIGIVSSFFEFLMPVSLHKARLTYNLPFFQYKIVFDNFKLNKAGDNLALSSTRWRYQSQV
jgi:hypothetical protein